MTTVISRVERGNGERWRVKGKPLEFTDDTFLRTDTTAKLYQHLVSAMPTAISRIEDAGGNVRIGVRPNFRLLVDTGSAVLHADVEVLVRKSVILPVIERTGTKEIGLRVTKKTS